MPARLLDDEGQPDAGPGNPRSVIEAELVLTGRRLRVRIAAADRPARLGDLVPLAQALADRLVQQTAQQACAGGATVPCRRGCTSCCRYLVPLSAPEAARLNEEILSLARRRRRAVVRSFLASARRLLAAPPPLLPDGPFRDGGATVTPAGAAGQWYARLDLACPLLVEGACSMYPSRPIACREHMVCSPPAWCRSFQPGRGRIVPVPVSVLEAMAILAAEVEHLPLEAVMMPLAPAWCDANAVRAARAWPARELVEGLVAVLHRLSAPQVPPAADRAA